MSEKIHKLLRDQGVLAGDIRNLSGVIDHLDQDVLVEVSASGGAYRAAVPVRYLEDSLRKARKEMIHEMHKADTKIVALEQLLEEQA